MRPSLLFLCFLLAGCVRAGFEGAVVEGDLFVADMSVTDMLLADVQRPDLLTPSNFQGECEAPVALAGVELSGDDATIGEFSITPTGDLIALVRRLSDGNRLPFKATRGPGGTYGGWTQLSKVSTPESPMAEDLMFFSRPVGLPGLVISRHQAGLVGRRLEICPTTLLDEIFTTAHAPCDVLDIFVDGTLETGDQDGPSIAYVGGDAALTFNIDDALYWARARSSGLLSWDATPVESVEDYVAAGNATRADDPSFSPGGEVIFFSLEISRAGGIESQLWTVARQEQGGVVSFENLQRWTHFGSNWRAESTPKFHLPSRDALGRWVMETFFTASEEPDDTSGNNVGRRIYQTTCTGTF